MKGLPFVLAFTAMTFVAWGAYGPLLHHGTASMGRDSLRAFVGVGIAYFIIAVLVPIYILKKQGEAGKWTLSGTVYSLIAGSVGALGALGVILALSYGGTPVYVMPLVFGFAPIVNTLVTAWMSKTFDQISPIFIGGIIAASIGVGGVLAFKPIAPPHTQDHTSDSKSNDSKSEEHGAEKSPEKKNREEKSGDGKQDSKSSNFAQTSLLRYVSMLPQEPADDGLPPVVVQPSAPEATAQPTATKPQNSEPLAQPEELPPVAVQPALPETTSPTKLPTNTNPEAVELPPVVIQPVPPPTPIPSPAESPKELTTAPEEALASAPKATQLPPETSKPETSNSEPTVPSDTLQTERAAKSPTVQKQPTFDPNVDDAPSRPRATWVPLESSGSRRKNARSPAADQIVPKKDPQPANVPMIVLSIIVAAVCWGSYGPMLHQGQAKMGGSRMRPFTCVGLAYFFIAVAAPLALIANRTADTGSWSVGGLSWSVVAGAAGAIGALGVLLAFNAGGKPYYVMPLVFGFAPVINTCISLTESGTWGLVKPEFWISLSIVIAGAITVLINAPKPQHAKPHAAPSPATASGQ